MPKVRKPTPSLGRTFLREWRTFRELTQEKVAEAVGVNRAHISKIENGRAAYNQPLLEKLAALYRCTPGDLLDRDPRTGGADLMNMVRNLPANQVGLVTDFIGVLRRTG